MIAHHVENWTQLVGDSKWEEDSLIGKTLSSVHLTSMLP